MRAAIARVVLVLCVAAFAGGAAIAFSDAQPREYTSAMRFSFGRLLSPELQVLGPNFSDPVPDAGIRLQTEAAVVASFDVARATAAAAPDLGYTAGEVARHVDVLPIRDTLVVAITAHSSTPERAARLAGVYGEQFLRLRRGRDRTRAGVVERALKAQLAALSHKETLGLKGAALRDQLGVVGVLRRVGTGSPEIIERPKLSAAPSSPDTTRNVLFGILFGLALGIGMVALRAESRSRAAGAARRASNAVRAR
ncbi:MAG TPA: hypothetical protein VF545_10630 [Thermoleophilaceae bacterium]